MADDTPKSAPKSTEERTKAFLAERARRAKDGIRIQADTQAEVLRLLKEAQTSIAAELAGTPSDWQAYHLTKLRDAVVRAIGTMEAGMGQAVSDGLDKSWQAGVQLVDAPIAAAGVELAGMMPAIDTRRLEAMRAFCTDRIQGIAGDLVNAINGELGIAMIGGKTPFDAAQAIAKRIEAGGINRAVTIVQTELGAAFSAATQARQEQAASRLPGLRKQWRRSGKTHSRLTHDLTDGQIRKPEEPFLIGGAPIMFPRDPQAAPKDRIRCGCTSLPHMAHWEVRHPLDKPFTQAELDASQAKRRLQEVKATGYDTWAKRTLDGSRKPDGTVMTAGSLPPDVEDFLKRKADVALYTREIGVADRMLKHYVRDAKVDAAVTVGGKRKRGKAVPARVARRLPEILANPKAVLWDLGAGTPTLQYIADVGGGETRLARFTVRLAERDGRQKLERHNFVISAGLVAKSELANPKAYQLVRGAL